MILRLFNPGHHQGHLRKDLNWVPPINANQGQGRERRREASGSEGEKQKRRRQKKSGKNSKPALTIGLPTFGVNGSQVKARLTYTFKIIWHLLSSAKCKEERCTRNPSDGGKTENQLCLLDKLRLLLLGIFLSLLRLTTRGRPQHTAQEIQHHGAVSVSSIT